MSGCDFPAIRVKSYLIPPRAASEAVCKRGKVAVNPVYPGPTLAERERLYVIGDIHGHSALLERMIDEICRDLKAAPVESCLSVTIGDYVDRGPNSRAVIDRLVQNPFPTEFIALRGNHDELFQGFMINPAIAADWRRFGALETLHSYGVNIRDLMKGQKYELAAEALRAALPAAHLEFLTSLRPSLTVGRYFLCHAGVRPGIPLEQQCTDDLLWIREPFLKSKADFGKIIVHGHTPVQKPEVFPNRINVDTGAYMTGQLTCAVLEREHIRFLSVS